MLKYLTVDHETYQVEEIVYKAYGVMLDKCWEYITMEDANYVNKTRFSLTFKVDWHDE